MPDETDQPILISVNRGDAPFEPFPSPLDQAAGVLPARSGQRVPFVSLTDR
jgi:hypothetical protein